MSVPKVIQDIRSLKSETSSIKNTYLTANKTIYVSTSGNDSTGDGTSSKPYATVTKAASTIPTNMNGFNVTINIAAGRYPINADIYNKTGGWVILSGASNAAVSLGSVNVLNSRVRVENINLTLISTNGAGILVREGGLFYSIRSITCNSYSGISCFASEAIVNGVVMGVNQTAIDCNTNSRVYIANISGTCSIGFYAVQGGIISYSTESLTASSSKVVTSSGGRILSGSQSTTANTLATASLSE